MLKETAAWFLSQKMLEDQKLFITNNRDDIFWIYRQMSKGTGNRAQGTEKRYKTREEVQTHSEAV